MLSGANCVDFLFVCFQREKVSLYIHTRIFKRISFNKRGKKQRGVRKSEGRGGQAQPGAIQSDPKAPQERCGTARGGRAPVMPGAPRGPSTLPLRARGSHGCQPRGHRSRGACRVRSPVGGAINDGGARCPQPAPAVGASLGPSAPPRKRSRVSEQRAGEHRGEGQGGERVVSPDPESP